MHGRLGRRQPEFPIPSPVVRRWPSLGLAALLALGACAPVPGALSVCSGEAFPAAEGGVLSGTLVALDLEDSPDCGDESFTARVERSDGLAVDLGWTVFDSTQADVTEAVLDDWVGETVEVVARGDLTRREAASVALRQQDRLLAAASVAVDGDGFEPGDLPGVDVTRSVARLGRVRDPVCGPQSVYGVRFLADEEVVVPPGASVPLDVFRAPFRATAVEATRSPRRDAESERLSFVLAGR